MILAARSSPMPSMLGELFLPQLDHRGERLGIVANRAGRIAIRPHAERVLALEIEDVPDQVEGVGDRGVGHA